MNMRRHLPWPFEGDRFPDDLGAVVQRTVLGGELPARVVGHGSDGSWYVGDGVNDPNEPGATVATHMRHVLERNSSVATLATLPPGHRAVRDRPGDSWRVEPMDLED